MMYGPQRGQRGYVPPPRINASPYISAVDTYEELEKVLPKCVEMFSLDDFERLQTSSAKYKAILLHIPTNSKP